MDNPEKLATQTKKNKQKHNTICVGHNYAQANTNNLNHDTQLTATEYLCYTSPHLHIYTCPVLLSPSGDEITTIPEYPSSARSPHAMALQQLTSILFTKLNDGLRNRFNFISFKRMTTIDKHFLQQQGKTLFLAKSDVKLTSKYSRV